MFDGAADPQLEWLYHVGPVGLVIGPNVIRDEDLTPQRQSAVETEAVAKLLGTDLDGPALPDPWAFFERILGWEARYVAGAPNGPDLPIGLAARVDEHGVTLAPDWAVRDLGTSDPAAFQILVKLHTSLEADQRNVIDGWQASPHQQFERLLHDTEIAVGVLVDRAHLRLVYAPPRETSGWLSFPLRGLGKVPGRTMLAGLKLMLGHARLFTEPEARRLPKLLARSREAQNKVSERLAEQVLGALHELLRAFHAADPKRIEALAESRPHHLYEGLLTTLMRLVFLLYAEDRELMPSQRTGQAVEVYEQGYSVRGLYARLAEDRALHPDTMDERIGAWGRLLALFRLVHGGHPSGWITARGGKLFDPNAFPFLEGRNDGEPLSAGTVMPIRDGAILRILEGLMTVEARSVTGERVRERLSYRSLDVEQIGSVYETVMGFTVLRATGPMIAVKGEKNLPVFVEIETLTNKKGSERQKLLKDSGVAPTGRRIDAIKNAEGIKELTEALAAICDPRGSPGGHVTPAGSPIFQPTDERRRTGSHYTPRSLTEPIVRHALEPAFERLGPNATPEQILDLKVCDPAMGSGAFLAEACRALAAKLVEAWSRHPGKKPKIPDDEEEDLHARRLVAQRCLYGVDKNPLATDLAKLSLWLATLARDHEFTFLDHALKSGDSLVGLTQTQIAAAHWEPSKPGLPLFRLLVQQRIAEAMKGRAEIRAAPDDTARAIQEARHRSLEQRIKDVRLIGDAVIAAFFAEDKPKPREKKRAEVESWLTGSIEVDWNKIAGTAAALKQGAHPITPFHWEIEFPEVFARENGGFDTVVGNPPFAGAIILHKSNHPLYSTFLRYEYRDSGGKCDLVAFFFRRAFTLIRIGASFGLIATNTIAQGATRSSGLRWLRHHGAVIYRATRRLKWPGQAAVVVSVVHVANRLPTSHVIELNGKPVQEITAFLFPRGGDDDPSRLRANESRAFLGVKIYGQGFLFGDDRDPDITPLPVMYELVKTNPSNRKVIKEYLGGEEINDEPQQLNSRFVIDFDEMTESEAEKWPDIMKIVKLRVKPRRQALTTQAGADKLKKFWWRYYHSAKELYQTVGSLERCLVCSQTSKHFALCFRPSTWIFSQKVVVFAFSSWSAFALLQCRLHSSWAEFFGSSLEDRPVYTPWDCFETFPLALDFENRLELEAAGRAYHDHRAALMVARNEGMTKTYNRFHDRSETAEDIQRLRGLHAAMDRAVLEAYGWHDLAARAEPIFLDEENEDDHTYQDRLFWPSDFRDEVLARLLALNAERHAEEVRLGIAPGMKGKAEADDEEKEFERE
jgi:hypothetical protein